jgi:hypothetical protein
MAGIIIRAASHYRSGPAMGVALCCAAKLQYFKFDSLFPLFTTREIKRKLEHK